LTVGPARGRAQSQTGLAEGRVVLFPRIAEEHRTHSHAYGRSGFAFRVAERSDVQPGHARNSYDLLYGNISTDRDLDWFEVEIANDDRSRIRDLGELAWAEVGDVAVLEPSERTRRGITISDTEEELERVSDGVVAKAHEGHIYVERVKDTDADFLVVFRVDRLVPRKRCAISWRLVADYSSEPGS
jgi:hypothetical protein